MTGTTTHPGRAVATDPTPSRVAGAAAEALRCRSCDAPLGEPFVDLGVSPLANAYVRPDALGMPESFYPLRVFHCPGCLLVQLEVFETPDRIFGDYAYFSSYSDSWIRHAREYAERIIPRLGLGPEDQVIELASNDGYLLRAFVDAGVPVLGIEPAANVASVAIERGIPTLVRFFGESMAEELVAAGIQADLLIANNVLAHVPAVNDFVRGMKRVLASRGITTIEFPHLLRLIAGTQFDTIYHEHFSYFSLLAADRLFARHALTIFDVEEIPTHGGSLRIHVRHAENESPPISPAVDEIRARELAAGLDRREPYDAFGAGVRRTKRRLLSFLIEARERGARVVGYGAPAKASTLLNYCGIGTDLIEYTVDRSPHKQGCYLPGCRIPIHAPARIRETRPDYVLLLPWNLRDEIVSKMSEIRDWGGRFVVPVPEVEVLE